MEAPAIRNYLNDHLAGSVSALDLARRRAERDSGDLGRFLRAFSAELEVEQRHLRAAMRAVEAEPQIAKQGMAILGSWFDALRPRRRPPNQMRDIEVLASGVQAKALLWATVQRLAVSGRPLLAGPDIDRLQEMAASQARELSVLHDRAVQQDLDATALPGP